MLKKNKSTFIISFLLGIVFIISAWSKYYPVEPFEFAIVKTGFIGWKASLIVARVIIAIEFTLGVLLLFSYRLKSTSKIVAAVLIIFTLQLIWSIINQGNTGDCGCFGELLPMTPLQAIIKNIVLLIAAIYLSFSKLESTFPFKRFGLFLLCFFLTFIFALDPVDYTYSKTYLDKPFENFELNVDTVYETQIHEKIGIPKIDIRDQKLILAFLSSTCSHCKIAAKKLAVIHQMNPKIPFYFFINGNDEDIQKFIEITGIKDIPNSKLNGETFVKLAGLHLPVIYYYNHGKIEKQVDYYTLEQYHIEDWLNEK